MIYDETKPSSILYQSILNISNRDDLFIRNTALYAINLFYEFYIKLKLKIMPCFRVQSIK